MTEPTHAPGPRATDGEDYGWRIVDLQGARVATVWRDGPPKSAANARLIAAAPELLLEIEWLFDAYLDALSNLYGINPEKRQKRG